MLFHTIEFGILFFISLLFNYLFKDTKKVVSLLFVCLFFYCYSASSYLFFLIASITLTYFAALKINQSKRANFYFYTAVILNLLLLIFFKLQKYIIPTLAPVLPNDFHYSFILPLGISFYVFQAISYLVDVKRKHIGPEKNFALYALYIMYFPNLIAGPIERVKDLIPQLKKKSEFKYSNFKIGGLYFLMGLLKKLIIADRLEFLSNDIIANWHTLPPFAVMIGGYCIVFYYYFDFSAYSEMAMGLAYMMDVKLVKNFNSPLWSSSPIEFWRKWHISLMNWLVDYVFTPILRLDFSFINGLVASLVVFILVGFWHGATLNFAIWGLVNGIVVCCNIIYRKYFGKKENSKYKPLKIFLTFHYFVWNGLFIYLPTIGDVVFFYKTSVHYLVSNFFGFFNWFFNLSPIKKMFLKNDVIVTFILLLIILIGEKVFEKKSFIAFLDKRGLFFRWSLYTVSILLLIFYSFSGVKNYVYVRF